jgi:hypothetical protein
MLNKESQTSKAHGRSKVSVKLSVIISRKYIAPGFGKKLIDFFAVPKGEDIRLVCNGSTCGLNSSLGSPNFRPPYPRTAM